MVVGTRLLPIGGDPRERAAMDGGEAAMEAFSDAARGRAAAAEGGGNNSSLRLAVSCSVASASVCALRARGRAAAFLR